MSLNATEIAELADHEAVPRGLPRFMEAWLVVAVEGRIDSPAFRIALTLEPMRHARPWAVYRREGAVIHVGQQAARLNPAQLALFNAADAMAQAGDDVARRLAAWPALVQALHDSTQTRIRVQGTLPRVHLHRTAPPIGSLTRHGRALRSATADALWAMAAGHRYYLPQKT